MPPASAAATARQGRFAPRLVGVTGRTMCVLRKGADEWMTWRQHAQRLRRVVVASNVACGAMGARVAPSGRSSLSVALVAGWKPGGVGVVNALAVCRTGWEGCGRHGGGGLRTNARSPIFLAWFWAQLTEAKRLHATMVQNVCTPRWCFDHQASRCQSARVRVLSQHVARWRLQSDALC